MTKINEKYLNEVTNQEIMNFCPFGYSDIETATQTALEAGKTTGFVFETVEEFSNSCDIKISDCDPVYCVYDALMQEARDEIDNKINFDICNDMPNGSFIEVHGNFMCSCFNANQDAIELLTNNLKQNGIKTEDLKEATQWFLSELEINL